MDAPPTDFAAECREAFVNHCLTLRSLRLDVPGQRNQAAKRRAAILGYIDDILDAANDWAEVEAFDRELAS